MGGIPGLDSGLPPVSPKNQKIGPICIVGPRTQQDPKIGPICINKAKKSLFRSILPYIA